MNNEDEMFEFLRKEILNELEYAGDISDENLEEIIARKLNKYSRERYISLERKVSLGKELMHSMRKLDILQDLIDDESITEIMVNGYDTIFVEKAGALFKTNREFISRQRYSDIIQQIVAGCNRAVNDSSPIVDARLSNGSRVNIVLNPVAINGPIMTIRRFPDSPFTMKQLISIGSISEEAAVFLKKAVRAGFNIIVAGGTGSGKTTFLNALSAYIPSDERIITIEDSAELQIQGIENLVRLETKNANVEGCNPITIRDLIKTSLRMRPDRIIVGEVRGAEAMDMICSAMNCGHDGSMSTVHANSARDTIGRLETMILMAVDLPVSAISRQICSGVDIIVHLARMRDKTRKVLEIVELDRYENGEIIFNDLYRFEEDKSSIETKVTGDLKGIGRIKHEEKFKASGIKI